VASPYGIVAASTIMHTAGQDWGAVVALKSGGQVKSRLASLPETLRQRLAWAMAADTLTALAPAVRSLVVVSGWPDLERRLALLRLPVEVLPEPAEPGLDAAFGHGEHWLLAEGLRGVLACVADLPALRTATVGRVLAAAPPGSRSFVPDAAGVGTTMLLVRGRALDPRFGGSSAERHESSGARRLDEGVLGDLADARQDVDVEADLARARRLGLGRHTAALLEIESRLTADQG
jgi:2-phospho-L-lactate guanylyltransferase